MRKETMSFSFSRKKDQEEESERMSEQEDEEILQVEMLRRVADQPG